ncbi:MAG: C25 family cysteine peptidase [Candidatus Neomarinimicrobiota bacterium]|nr:C25 family cysteine peptidase [Candidatus Neomarinimicrobiota bacterium]
MLQRFLFYICFIMGIVSATQIINENNSNTNLKLEQINQNILNVNVSIGDITTFATLTDKGEFVRLSLSDYHLSRDEGDPELPEIHSLIEIPINSNPRIEIISHEYKDYILSDYNINSQIYPAQPSLSKSQNPEDLPFILNDNAYSKNEMLQKAMVEVDILGQMRALRLANLLIRPIDYNPVEGILRVYTNIEINIHMDNGDYEKTTSIKNKLQSPYFDAIYNQISNYQSENRDDMINDPVTYVIITNPIFLNTLNDFIEWKTQKGFNVIVGNTAEIGSSTSSIKNFIENLYDNPSNDMTAPSFVLFVGDVAQVPTYSGTTGSHPTDLYYVDMSGDMIPDIYHGRFSAQNLSQLQSQINKTLEYEKYEMPDPSYLGEVLMVAGVDASYASTYGNGQINYGNDYYFNNDHGIYSHTYLYPASDAAGAAAAIIQDYNEGVGFANYTAHCSPSGWADPSFTVSDVPGLYNDHEYNLMIGNCCNSAQFDVESFGEAVLRSENNGAIGYIGGTNSTYWNEDYWWGVGNGNIVANPTYSATGPGAYDCSFHENNEENWAVANSTLMLAGNLAVTEAGGSLVDYYWEIYHNMGDPSISTYFGIPSENNLTHTEFLPLGSSSISISGAPHTYVGITHDGTLLGSGRLDSFGNIELSLSGATMPGTAQIVGTCQNHQPYFGEILIASPEGPYVMVENTTFTSGSGDESNIIQFGETVNLSLNLENVGNDDATGVEINLSTNDPFINITSGSITVFSLPSDNSYNAEGFEFMVDANVPNEHDFEINCTISANGEIWESSLNFIAYAPIIEVDAVVGNLDPGMTTTLEAYLSNTGDADIHSPVVSVVGDSYVTINESSFTNAYVWDNGDEINNEEILTLSVSVNPSTPIGHIAEFSITVNSNQPPTTDYEENVVFTIPVGQLIANFESGLGNIEWDLSCSGIGCNNWSSNESEAYSGSSSAKSGSIGNSQSSDISVTLDVTANGQIEFYYKVSAEYSTSGNYFYDGLEFYIDNTLMGQYQTATDGSSPWTYVSYDVSAGEHTFKWSYVKDAAGGSTDCENTDCEDAAWIDDVIFPPAYVESEGMAGDVNMDQIVNILDVVVIINMILGMENENMLADMNADGNINIQDIILVINLILSDDLSRNNTINKAEIKMSSNKMIISANNSMAGLELHTAGDYVITKKNLPKGWEFFKNNHTIIMVDIEGRKEFNSIEMEFDGELIINNNIISDWHGNGISASIIEMPKKVTLHSIYPNPFNPIASINYELSKKDNVNISIYNLSGQLMETLFNDLQNSGMHFIEWNASNYPSGMYFVSMKTSNESFHQKLMLMK